MRLVHFAMIPLTAIATACSFVATDGHSASAAAVSVQFTPTPVPNTPDDMLFTHTKSSAVVRYADGSTRTVPLSYMRLFQNTDRVAKVNGQLQAAAQLYDVNMQPLRDPWGEPVVAETADANSLLKVGDQLFMVTHWEYDDVYANGAAVNDVTNGPKRMPMSMSLSAMQQGADGALKVTSQRPVDFASVNGGWIFCAASQTPWNTHLGGEEDYDLYFVPGEKSFGKTQDGLKAISEVYFKGKRQANPYDYGYPIEVAVAVDGSTTVTKHHEMGRGTWELARFTNDGRTAFFGDDGSYSGLFMFVGDKANDPNSGGTLYAARWEQSSADNSDADTRANVHWIRLGHTAGHAEIAALIHKGIQQSDIFDISLTAKDGLRPVRAGSSQTIWLKLKPGMELAAAFLETRRYAAYLGATTEFTKGEGVAINHADKKMYYAMSYIQGSMLAKDGGPVDHVRVKANDAGATFTFDLAGGQRDIAGAMIASDYVPTLAYIEPKLLGKPIAADADGNTADVNAIANTDNVVFNEKLRTLFVGEDSGHHVNNFLWAYNVDTKALTRIMSVAAGGESTGLQVLSNLNGHGYIMANSQHHGEWIKPQSKALTQTLEKRAGELFGVNHLGTPNYRLQADVGYIAGMPALR